MIRLDGLSAIRNFFRQGPTPIYFVNETPITLIGLDAWVHGLMFLCQIDAFDGLHPRVLVPENFPRQHISTAEVNNSLLEHPRIRQFIRSRGPFGKALFVFFNQHTEELCQELGLQVCFPPADLRTLVGNKIEATRLAESAGVTCVPHVLAEVRSYEELRSRAGHLGPELVVQGARGQEGETTYFISSEEDWKRDGPAVASAGEVRIMKRLRSRESALEACVTRHGTIIGPLMEEIVGLPELTIHHGGWCGAQIGTGLFSTEILDQARADVYAFGKELQKLGYRGYFEVDFLRDLDTGRLYFEEVNPRLTGDTTLTNTTAFAHSDAPLILFHLLEWFKVDYDLDIDGLNARWAHPEFLDDRSMLVFYNTHPKPCRAAAAPRTGVYQLDDHGNMTFLRPQWHTTSVDSPDQAFLLAETKRGDELVPGMNLCRLIVPGYVLSDDHQLNDRGRTWVNRVLEQFSY
ncbi:MAG: biotin carboxylase [bacterium]